MADVDMGRALDTAAPDGEFEIEFEVPDDLLSLAVELDEEAAAAAHAAFLDERLTDTAPAELRQQALAQLAAARQDLINGQVRYFGLASAELDGRWVMCLFGVSVVAFAVPEQFHPANLLAGVLRHQDLEDGALIEEFETPYGPAVGVRRADVLTVPASGSGWPQRIDTGAAQALVAFGELELVGVVSGYCLNLEDIDLTTAIVGVIAHTLNITAQPAPRERRYEP